MWFRIKLANGESVVLNTEKVIEVWNEGKFVRFYQSSDGEDFRQIELQSEPEALAEVERFIACHNELAQTMINDVRALKESRQEPGLSAEDELDISDRFYLLRIVEFYKSSAFVHDAVKDQFEKIYQYAKRMAGG